MCFLKFLKGKKNRKTQNNPKPTDPLEDNKETPGDLPSEGQIQALLFLFDQQSQGLLFPSESEYPFESFYYPSDISHPEESPSFLLKQLNLPESTKVEEVSLDRFFRAVAPVRDFFDERQKEEAPRFKALRALLEEQLTDLRVLRLGEIEITAVLIGKTSFPGLAGVKTRVVET